MSGFLKENSSEVRNMLFTEYDPVEARKVAIEEGFEDGLEQGIEKGMEKGIEKGRESGIKEGRAEGVAEERLKTAKRMKAAGMDSALIVEFTGLSEDEVMAL
jgi:predicted transposase/invertase (TIGR01784 family)